MTYLYYFSVLLFIPEMIFQTIASACVVKVEGKSKAILHVSYDDCKTFSQLWTSVFYKYLV